MRLSGIHWLLAVALLAAACRSSAPHDLATAPAANPPPLEVEIPTSQGPVLAADLYGGGDRGVVILAHGGYSSRESWTNQAQTLAASGFRVLVVESRAAADFAAGKETACLYDEVCQARDVLAAARHLRRVGVTSIALIGGSLGGGAVAQASVDGGPGEVDRIVLLAPSTIAEPEKMQGRKLFITTRDDANAAGPRLPGIQLQFKRAPEPKQFVLLEGSSHAQRIFLTDEGETVMRDILQFLMAP